MEFLPTTLGTRPRLAVELRAEGVVAARADDAAALLTAVARESLAEGALQPGLKPGNVADRTSVVAAVRSVLDSVAERGSERSRDVTMVVPDAAARVLLLDFDSLPSKLSEALPVVRFRLKKLLPFDADDAALSYQVMSMAKDAVRVVAVAMPKAVLDEYESLVIGAGYLPGAVLPSTLAALAGLDETATPALVVNAGTSSVTTAIVEAGILLLHRSVDMSSDLGDNTGVDMGSEFGAGSPGASPMAQGYDPFEAEAAMQNSVVQMAEARESSDAAAAHEVVQAVSVAAAYFEDTLRTSPEMALSAGTLGADALAAMMEESGLEGLRVREMVDSAMLAAGAATATVPRGWLAGVRGALRG
jgi:type IV pilus assembly protein PilM